MALIAYPWREGLRPASFRGASFRIEVQGQAGGRRVALHEYPKRDTPYGEDMGRRATRYRVTGYLVGPNYTRERDRLTAALDAAGPGTLVLPVLSAMEVMCDGYQVSEFREKGGWCAFEMSFVEAGTPGFSVLAKDTQQAALGAAGNAEGAAATSANNALGGGLTDAARANGLEALGPPKFATLAQRQ
jgi:prophage DNA circulation protein